MAFMDFFGKILVEELLENEQRAEFRLHQRSIRDVSDPFSLPNKVFKTLFRFNKDTAIIIINSEHLPEGIRVTSIPKHLKVLATLHFYATGGYQLSSGQGHSFAISQPTMSRCISEVTNIIYHYLIDTWINFPRTENDRNKIIDGFAQKFNFPRCLGAIDCTHIAIISSPEHYPALPNYCRKGYYSINCQIIVDSDLNILNMNARFPGSTHDSAIWQACAIKTVMENLYVQGSNSFLIGDSGYPLQPFLLTPFENPEENTPESNYNYRFVRARNAIERLNGVLKSRFRCLSKHRVLNFKPIKAGKIIYSCGVLHNIAQYYKDFIGDNEINDDEDNDNNDNGQIGEANLNWHGRGEAIRNEVVQQHFIFYI